jgi:hypothetical protein
VEIDLLEEEVKEEEEIRREVDERGAGGVAKDRRATAELDRRAFIVGYWLRTSAAVSVFLFG